MEALIAQTKALGWEDYASLLESISLVIQTSQLMVKWGNSSPIKAWFFVVPFTIKEIAPYRFLFANSYTHHPCDLLGHSQI
jgi:hypothetical protein